MTVCLEEMLDRHARCENRDGQRLLLPRHELPLFAKESDWLRWTNGAWHIDPLLTRFHQRRNASLLNNLFSSTNS